ncbi:hypothetical protein BB561_000989 [Smittium simulii]|uniref:SH3 domain-containing protein n=1 Tax=Smittium simulii TaxID=133385 RepID=A0A2T9YWN5_9FUNG|nr:hypothetical protein BB561_000989 [Smittium simulii]
MIFLRSNLSYIFLSLYKFFFIFTLFILSQKTIASKYIKESNQLVAYGEFSSLEINNIGFTDNTSHKLSWISSYSSMFSDFEVNPNGRIIDGCRIKEGNKDWIIVAGNFSSINSKPVGNIASVNMDGQFNDMNGGLNGPITGLLCDNVTDSVYVFGDFTSTRFPQDAFPIKPAVIKVARFDFTSNSWKSLPFVGLDGVVNSMKKTSDNQSLWIAGNFNKTMDGDYDNDYFFRPIDLNGAEFTVTNGTKEKSFKNINNIICNNPETTFKSSWMSQNNSPSSIFIDFISNINASMVSIYNTQKRDTGSKFIKFYHLKNSTMVPLTMQYHNTTSNSIKACDECYISYGTNEPHNFLFSSVIELNNLSINITDWYGENAGLSRIEIYQKNSVVHPNDKLNLGKCSDKNFDMKQVQKVGKWIEKKTQDTGMSYLEAEPMRSFNSLIDAPRSFILQPLIAVNAHYDVYLDIPKCTKDLDCSKRTTVNVQVKIFGDNDISMSETTIDQNTESDQTVLVYSGYLPKSSKINSVAVILSANTKSNDFKLETSKSIVVGDLKVIRRASFDNLPNLLKLDLNYRTSSTKDAYSKPDVELSTNSSIVQIAPYKNGLFFLNKTADSDNQLYYYNPNNENKLVNIDIPGKVYSTSMYYDTLYLGGELIDGNSTEKNIKGLAKLDIDDKDTNPIYKVQVLTDFNGTISSFVHSDSTLSQQKYLAFIGSLNQTDRSYNFNSDNIIGLFDIQNNSLLNPVLLNSKPTMLCFNSTNLVISGTSAKNISIISDSISVFNDFESQSKDMMTNSNRLPFYTTYNKLNSTLNKPIITSSVTNDDYEIVGGFFKFDNIQNIAKLYTPKNTFSSIGLEDKLDFGLFDNEYQYGKINQLMLSRDLLLIIGNPAKESLSSNIDSNNTIQEIKELKERENSDKIDNSINISKKNSIFQGFTIFDISKKKILYNFQPQNQNNNTAFNFNNALVNFDQSGFLVSGNFLPDDMGGCKNFCEFKYNHDKWESVGDNLITGQINSMTNYNEKIYLAGDLTIKGVNSKKYFVQLDFKRKTGFLVNQVDYKDYIVGPVLFMSHYLSKFFIAGYKNSNSSTPYLVNFDGEKFEKINLSNLTITKLTGISVVNQVMPDGEYSACPVLLGNFKFTKSSDAQNCSAVININNVWHPYIRAYNVNGSNGVLKEIRNSDKNFFKKNKMDQKDNNTLLEDFDAVQETDFEPNILVSSSNVDYQKNLQNSDTKNVYNSYNQEQSTTNPIIGSRNQKSAENSNSLIINGQNDDDSNTSYKNTATNLNSFNISSVNQLENKKQGHQNIAPLVSTIHSNNKNGQNPENNFEAKNIDYSNVNISDLSTSTDNETRKKSSIIKKKYSSSKNVSDAITDSGNQNHDLDIIENFRENVNSSDDLAPVKSISNSSFDRISAHRSSIKNSWDSDSIYTNSDITETPSASSMTSNSTFKKNTKLSQDSLVGKHVNMFENYDIAKPVIKSWTNNRSSILQVRKTHQKLRNLISSTESSKDESGKSINLSREPTHKTYKSTEESLPNSPNNITVSEKDAIIDNNKTALKNQDKRITNNNLEQSSGLAISKDSSDIQSTTTNKEKNNIISHSTVKKNEETSLGDVNSTGQSLQGPEILNDVKSLNTGQNTDYISAGKALDNSKNSSIEAAVTNDQNNTIDKKNLEINASNINTTMSNNQDLSHSNISDYSQIKKEIQKYIHDVDQFDLKYGNELLIEQQLKTEYGLDKILKTAGKLSNAESSFKADLSSEDNTQLKYNDVNDNKSQQYSISSTESSDLIVKSARKNLEKIKTSDFLTQNLSFQSLPKYRANFDFNSAQKGELNFNTGQTIYVTDTKDSIWWSGVIYKGPGNPIERDSGNQSHDLDIIENFRENVNSSDDLAPAKSISNSSFDRISAHRSSIKNSWDSDSIYTNSDITETPSASSMTSNSTFKKNTKLSQDSLVGKHVNMFENYDIAKPVIKSWTNNRSSILQVRKTHQKLRNLISSTESSKDESGKSINLSREPTHKTYKSTEESLPNSPNNITVSEKDAIIDNNKTALKNQDKRITNNNLEQSSGLAISKDSSDIQSTSINKEKNNIISHSTVKKNEETSLGDVNSTGQSLQGPEILNDVKSLNTGQNTDYISAGKALDNSKNSSIEAAVTDDQNNTIDKKNLEINASNISTTMSNNQDLSHSNISDYSQIKKEIQKYIHDVDQFDLKYGNELLIEQQLKTEYGLDKILKTAGKLSNAESSFKADLSSEDNTQLKYNDDNDDKSQQYSISSTESSDLIVKSARKNLEKIKTSDFLTQNLSFQSLPKYRASFDFNSTQKGELNFNTGQTIYVTDTKDSIWWSGVIYNGPGNPIERGIFPALYVEEIEEKL